MKYRDMETLRRAVLPDDAQLLLLHVALSSPERAANAWKQWNQRVDLDDADLATFRLLPTVYSALVSKGLSELATPRVKGIYRFWWVRQQQLFAALRESAQLLHAHEIPILLMKGVPLAHTIYADDSAYGSPAARAMEDADLCVPLAQLPRAIELLQTLNWRAKYPEYAGCSLRHEITLQRPPRCELDVQRYPIEACRWNAFNEQIFARALPFEWQNLPLLMPSHEDHLVIICAHGMRHSESISAHWVVDAVQLLRFCAAKNLDFNWSRVVQTARETELRAPLCDALTFLRAEFEIEVPETVLRELQKPQNWVFRQEYRAKLRPYNAANAFWLHAGLYARLKNARQPISPRQYVRRYWDIDGPLELSRVLRRHRRSRRAQIQKNVPGA